MKFYYKTKRCTMKVRRLRILALRVFRSLNNMNPDYIQNLFDKNTRSKRRSNDLTIPFHNTATFGDKFIKVVGAHIWNMLPNGLKSETSCSKFKDSINQWFGAKFIRCSACKYFDN